MCAAAPNQRHSCVDDTSEHQNVTFQKNIGNFKRMGNKGFIIDKAFEL